MIKWIKVDDAPSEVAVGDRIYWINGRYSIIFDIKDEIKMTREEAEKIWNEKTHPQESHHSNNISQSKKAIAAYEALGLIKFEEKSMYNVVVDEKVAKDFKLQGYFVEIRK